MLLDLHIENNGKYYYPVIIGPITYSNGRHGTIGELQFTVKKDSKLNFTEGNVVTFKVDGKGIFKGRVFTKSRDKNQLIEVKAVDQFKYLTNKDTRKNGVGTVGALIKTIASELGLKVGVIDDTKFPLPSRIESETTYLDMIMKDIETTTQKTRVDYAFYDDFGNITLKNYDSMKVDFNVTLNNIENFSYSSSIDGEVYNQIKIANSSEESVVVHKVVSDQSSINKWGVLQYVQKLDDDDNADVVAWQLLDQYNRKIRKLSVSRVFGDSRIRAGSIIKVTLPLGDVAINSEMCVEKCTHSYTGETHFMDLVLVSSAGGEFVE